MRTLKKTLCLVLALVMCLGLMSTAFASKVDTFPDVASVDQIEAADYLVAAGVIEGTDNGLEPDAKFTRAQAAKLIAYMMLGKTNAENYQITGEAFDDVSINHWGAKYIQYCSVEEYIKGDGDGKFMPEDNVTGLQFAAMLLRALGYDANGELSVNWPYSTQALALSVNLFNGVLSAASNEELDRDTAMQMQFNAMTAIATVQYNASFAVYFTGTTSFTANQGYKKGDEGWQDSNTLGQKNFNLVRKGTDDGLGRPMREWMNSKTGLVVTNKYPDYNTLDVEVTARSSATTLSRSIENSNSNAKPVLISGIWVNGTSNYNIDEANAQTAVNSTKDAAEIAIQAVKNGFQVELIDTNDNGLADRIIVVVEFVAIVDKVTAAKGPDAAKATIKVVKDTSIPTKGIDLSADYYDISNLVKDDILVVIPHVNCTPKNPVAEDKQNNVEAKPAEVDPTVDDGKSGTDDAVISIPESPIVVSDVTSFEGDMKDSNPNTLSVTFGGATYNYSAVAANNNGEPTATNPFVKRDGYKINGSTYDFYLNSSNVVIGVTEHQVVDAIPNVIYVTAVESKTKSDSLFGNSGENAARVEGYLADGTKTTFDLKLSEVKKDENIEAYSTVGAANNASTKKLADKASYLEIKANNEMVENQQSGKKEPTKAPMYFAIEKTETVKDPGTIVGNVFAYSTDEKGMTTLTQMPNVANKVTYAGQGLEGAIKVQKNSAEVVLGIVETTGGPGPDAKEEFKANQGGNNTLYATTATNLVVVDGKGGVTKYTGYNNFPGEGPNGKFFSVGGPENVKIFYVTSKTEGDPKTIVTDIVVIGSEERPAPQKVLFVATSNWKDVAGKDGQNDKMWEFVNAATGEADYYLLDGTLKGYELEKGDIYLGEVGPDGFKPDANNVTYHKVEQVTNTYVRIDDGKLLYMPEGFVAYNIDEKDYPATAITTKIDDEDVYIYYTVKDETGNKTEDWTLTGAFITVGDPTPPQQGNQGNQGGNEPPQQQS